jgi:hypothetical protein
MVVRNAQPKRVEQELPAAHVRTNDDGTAVLVVPMHADEAVEVLATHLTLAMIAFVSA